MDKKFDLERGKMTFTGAHELNPLLDVVAHHEVAGYTVAPARRGGQQAPPDSNSAAPRTSRKRISCRCSSSARPATA